MSQKNQINEKKYHAPSLSFILKHDVNRHHRTHHQQDKCNEYIPVKLYFIILFYYVLVDNFGWFFFCDGAVEHVIGCLVQWNGEDGAAASEIVIG